MIALHAGNVLPPGAVVRALPLAYKNAHFRITAGKDYIVQPDQYPYGRYIHVIDDHGLVSGYYAYRFAFVSFGDEPRPTGFAAEILQLLSP